jgi:GxxExxY protein
VKNSTTNHTNSYLWYAHEQQDILYKDDCYEIYGCIYAVNRKLGTGFLEAVYQEALEIEFRRKNIPFVSQQELKILYDDIPFVNKYIADLACYEKIIIKLKAVSKINDQHKTQLMNYLAVTGYKLGLLVNFRFLS